MTHPEPKRIAIAVVQRRTKDGQVELLVGRRNSDQTLGDFDEFPGGAVEPNESASAAAVRECREETGLGVRVIEPLATVQHRYEFGLLHLFFFRCEVDPSVAPSDAVDAPYRWLSLNQLTECVFPPANKSVVARLLPGKVADEP